MLVEKKWGRSNNFPGVNLRNVIPESNPEPSPFKFTICDSLKRALVMVFRAKSLRGWANLLTFWIFSSHCYCKMANRTQIVFPTMKGIPFVFSSSNWRWFIWVRIPDWPWYFLILFISLRRSIFVVIKNEDSDKFRFIFPFLPQVILRYFHRQRRFFNPDCSF